MPRPLTACLLLLAVLLGATLALRLALSDPSAALEPALPPASAHPQAQGPSVPPGGDFLGVIIPSASVELVPRFEGRLEAVEVQVGAHVSAGSALVRLERGPLSQELAIAQAALETARAQEQLAQVALAEARERAQRNAHPKLVSLQVVSEEERASARFQEKSASAKLSAAQAQVREQLARVEQGRQRLEDTVLKAPFDGVVAERYFDPGAQVSPSRPILRLLGAGGLRVRFAIPEDEVHKVSPGAPLQIRLAPGNTLLPGRVESLAPEVDAASRMVLALARLDRPPGPEVPAGKVVRVLVGPGTGGAPLAASEGSR